ncbi:hypothetical protein OF83DRAFT_1174162 [Amylostereum chailletii]|nr:hypothetical protein OF83DRAFT_1174162 [Amylostereum chailletii]
MHRVLTTPELVDHIFSYSSRDDNAASALVCKSWVEIARDHIWDVVLTPCQLFRLLAPTLCPENGDEEEVSHDFERFPTRADWTRFQPFARRVRHLEIVNSAPCACKFPYYTRLIRDIALSRPDLIIFPNLRMLAVCGESIPQESTLLFLHPGLRDLSLINPENSEYYPNHIFFEDVLSRVPALRSFSLTVRLGHAISSEEEATLARCLSALPLLFVSLPQYFITSKIVQALSASPSLQILTDLLFNLSAAYDALAPFSPILPAGSFQSLEILTLSAHFSDLIPVIQHATFSSKLRRLHIRALRGEPRVAVQGLCTVISEYCLSLQNLALVMVRPKHFVADADRLAWGTDVGHEALQYDAIRSLVKLPQLFMLDVIHTKPLQLSDHDIEDIAKSKPDIVRLVLNPVPRRRTERTLPLPTLLSLTHLARCCRYLRVVGLYIDARVPVDIHPSLCFEIWQLASVYLRCSPIAEVQRRQVAMFLSRMLPPHAKFEKDPVQMAMDACVGEVVPDSSWEWVEDRLSLLQEARWDECERRRLQCTCPPIPADGKVDANGQLIRAT